MRPDRSMATSLRPEHRAQLDGIVQKMQANGETDAYIQGVVNDFKTKYAGADSTAPVADSSAPGALPRMPMVGSGHPLGAFATRHASSALGMVGGAVGGIPGALAGGTLGEGVRQVGMGEPLDPGRAIREGGWQGAYQMMGGAIGKGAASLGPAAVKAANLMKNPIARRVAGAARVGIPIGGYASGGIPGALTGAALPYAGRAAMRVAMSPRTAAFLSSRAFQAFARQNPRGAAELYQQLVLTEQPDATSQ